MSNKNYSFNSDNFDLLLLDKNKIINQFSAQRNHVYQSFCEDKHKVDKPAELCICDDPV